MCGNCSRSVSTRTHPSPHNASSLARRGIAGRRFTARFNEWHIVAITQAICRCASRSSAYAAIWIVFGSVFMVHSARSLGDRVGLGDVVMGAIILSALTGIPNLIAALRLARKHRGAFEIAPRDHLRAVHR